MFFKIVTFFVIISNSLYAQELIVIDSISKTKLPYTTIEIGDSIYSTNINGKLEINSFQKEVDYGIVSYLGYKQKKIKINKNFTTDTIRLVLNPIVLEEVNLKSFTKDKFISFGKKPNNFSRIPLAEGNYVTASLIPLKNNKNTLISSIYLKFYTNCVFCTKEEFFNAILELSIYDSNNNELYTFSSIELLNNFEGIIKFQLQEKLFFEESGITLRLRIKNSTISKSSNNNYFWVATMKNKSKEFNSKLEFETPIKIENEELRNAFNRLLKKRTLAIALELKVEN